MKPLFYLTIGALILTVSVGSTRAAEPRSKAQTRPQAARKQKEDVSKTHWAYAAVQDLKARKIMGNRANGRFEGDKPVTRYEFAVALDRFVRNVEEGLKKAGETLNESKVIDKPAVNAPKGHWAYASMRRLAAYGYLPASSKVLQGPSDTLTAKEIGQSLGQVAIHLNDLIVREPSERSQQPPGSSKDLLPK
jgi:hypothetical protein